MLGLPCFLSSCGEWGLLSGHGVQASHCGGFSCGAWAAGHVGIGRGGPWTVGLRLNCGAQAWCLCSTWDPASPGIEPVSPALTGRLSAAEPPGKSPSDFLDFGGELTWETVVLIQCTNAH